MSSSRMVRWVGTLIVLACAAAAGAVPAIADSLRLDSDFGGDGKVTLPAQLGQPQAWGMPKVQVATPEGALVAATGSTIVRLLPNGQPDAAFGQDGTVAAAQPEGAGFEISAISVDSQGRVLIAGTSTYPALANPPKIPGGATFAGWSGPPPTPQLARIVRYLPDGTPDPTFGTGGVVETDFGLPPPTDSSGRSLLERPWVEATSVAVDSQDRVLVSGGASVRPTGYCIHDSFGSYLEFASYVARLDQRGAPDASFGGGDGVTEMRTARSSSPLRAELATKLRVDASGRPTYLAQPSRFCRPHAPSGVVRLQADGKVGFAHANELYGSYVVEDVVVDSKGRVVMLELRGTRHPREAMHARITRLNRHGAVDTAFGRRGHVWLRQPGDQTRLSAIATDAHCRVLLAGVLASRQTIDGEPFGPPLRQHFLLMRLGPHGGLSRSLGRRGRKVIGFGNPSHALATDLVVDPLGDVVLAGFVSGTEGGVALARLVPAP